MINARFGQIHDQAPEFTRDFRVGFDKGDCSNSSPVLVFNHRSSFTLSTTGFSPIDTLRTVSCAPCAIDIHAQPSGLAVYDDEGLRYFLSVP